MQTKSNILIALAVLVVGLVSFISGRVSVGHSNGVQSSIPQNVQGAVSGQGPGSPIVTSNPSAKVETGGDLTVGGGTTTESANYPYVASKNGTRYFPVTCGSSKTIKPENAIYFQTAAEAEASGKTQSPQCKY